MAALPTHIRFIERFLAHFDSCFSTANQRAVFKKFIYAMFNNYKRMPLAAVARNTDLNYQKLQSFFSESRWNIKELNDIRLKLKKISNFDPPDN